MSDVLCWIVLREGFDDEVEPEPQTPTVVIEKHRKDQPHRKQQHQHIVVIGANYQQKEETNQQNHEFRGHYVREDRTHKKPIFTLEQRLAVRAVVPDVKRMSGDIRVTTGGTTQS